MSFVVFQVVVYRIHNLFIFQRVPNRYNNNYVNRRRVGWAGGTIGMIVFLILGCCACCCLVAFFKKAKEHFTNKPSNNYDTHSVSNGPDDNQFPNPAYGQNTTAYNQPAYPLYPTPSQSQPYDPNAPPAPPVPGMPAIPPTQPGYAAGPVYPPVTPNMYPQAPVYPPNPATGAAPPYPPDPNSFAAPPYPPAPGTNNPPPYAPI